MATLTSVIYYIVDKTTELKNTIPEAYFAPIEFVCIFCQTEEDYKKYSRQISEMGKVVENTPTGFTYLLKDPLETMNGFVSLVKIRKPDSNRSEVGDADFNSDYKIMKEKYLGKQGFELIKRNSFEMLRFVRADYDVMVCFSNIPKSISLGIRR